MSKMPVAASTVSATCQMGWKKARERVQLLPIREFSGNPTQHSCLHLIGPNLIRWPHQTIRENGKCRLVAGSWCSAKNQDSGHLKETRKTLIWWANNNLCHKLNCTHHNFRLTSEAKQLSKWTEETYKNVTHVGGNVICVLNLRLWDFRDVKSGACCSPSEKTDVSSTPAYTWYRLYTSEIWSDYQEE